MENGVITKHNSFWFTETLAHLFERARKVPAVPEDLTVQLTYREFAKLLQHRRPAVRDWVMFNLTQRLVTVTKRRAA